MEPGCAAVLPRQQLSGSLMQRWPQQCARMGMQMWKVGSNWITDAFFYLESLALEEENS